MSKFADDFRQFGNSAIGTVVSVTGETIGYLLEDPSGGKFASRVGVGIDVFFRALSPGCLKAVRLMGQTWWWHCDFSQT